MAEDNKETQLFGRRVLYANYDESDLSEDVIQQILNRVFPIHMRNVSEIEYLENYYRGMQPILKKVKIVRPEINNVVLENDAYFIVEFKKAYVFGEPIQYVQRGDIANEQVSVLNSYMLAEDKYSKDTELAESLYTSGIAHRIVLPDNDEDSPFSIENLDSKTTFCVYSSNIGHKKLFSVTYVVDDMLGTMIKGSIYTKNKYYKFEGPIIGNQFKLIESDYHILGYIPIVEYHLNKFRLGIVEVVMSLLNALNRLNSNDLDGIEQFIQSLIVFVNSDVDAEQFSELMKAGGVKITSSDPSKPADIKLLSADLSKADTSAIYNRLYEHMLTIVGVPSKNDKASGGDTGQARLLGEGWTMADERAKQDESAFKRCAKDELKLILRICSLTPNSGITTLQLKDIDQKFTRNKSDNLLVKAQGLLNMIQGGVSPDVAFQTSGLFSDANEVYNKAIEFYGSVEKWIETFASKKSTNNIQNSKQDSFNKEDSKKEDKKNNMA